MKRLRWQLLIFFIAIAIIAVLLFIQKPPAIRTVSPEPVTGGSYTEALIGEYSRLNPLFDSNNMVDHDVDRLLFNSLVRFDARGVPQSEVAESWGISRDGKNYNFSLRNDVNWHDGEPLTSADVIFTIDLLKDPAISKPADLQELWQKVEVEAYDAYNIQFRLPEPFAPFLDYLTFGILPSHLLSDTAVEELVNDSFNMAPIGSGPFVFDRLLGEDERIVGVVLQANDDYFDGRPFIDELIFRYYPDEVTALEAYNAGEVQGISNVSDEILEDALAAPNLNLYTSRLPQLTLIYLNMDNPEVPAFQDIAVRKALLNGMNRQRVVNKLLGGQAAIADGPIFPNSWAYFESIERVSYDPDAAVRILREAGYTIPAEGGAVRENDQGIRVAFTLLHPDDPLHTEIAEMVAQDWIPLGIGVTLEAMPYDELVSEFLQPRLYQAALIDLNMMGSPDPDPYPFWHQTQATKGQNYSMWNDRQASEYLEQARIIPEVNERTRLYRNFQVRFVGEMPALPLYFPMYTYAVDAEIQDVKLGPLNDFSDRFNSVTDWYLFAQAAVGGILDSEEVPAP